MIDGQFLEKWVSHQEKWETDARSGFPMKKMGKGCQNWVSHPEMETDVGNRFL